MDKYKITITTINEGQKSKVFADGYLKQTQEGRALVYRQGDGEVEFFLEGARMIRRGDYGLAMTFSTNEIAYAELSIGEHVGKMPLKTLYYRVSEEGKNIFVETKYILKQEGGYQSMEVCLEAKASR